MENSAEKDRRNPFDREKYLRLLVISGTVVFLDQLTKLIILNTLPLYDSIPIIPEFFSITHIHNPGGAFGFFAQQSLMILV